MKYFCIAATFLAIAAFGEAVGNVDHQPAISMPNSSAAFSENEANGFGTTNYAENEANGFGARNYARTWVTHSSEDPVELAAFERSLRHVGPVAVERWID